jgi:hypothetical protein
MPLADYYGRDALAISQVLSGFNEQSMRARLESVRLGISFSKPTAHSREGAALLRLVVRLAARLYPVLILRPSNGADPMAAELTQLAKGINPSIAMDSNSPPSIEIQVGPQAAHLGTGGIRVFAGSHGWNALISSESEQRVGPSTNTFGAAAAACLAMANVFRHIFLDDADVDRDLVFPTVPKALLRAGTIDPAAFTHGTLVGVGAVGNAAAWALAESPATGVIDLVDPESIELSNLQRYVLAVRSDVGKSKVGVAASHLGKRLDVRTHRIDWARFSEEHQSLPLVMVAVDSAAGRRAVQASLPKAIVNAWTQPGDLGVSVHGFDGNGACLACLYLPQGISPSEDAILSEALRIPDQIMRVRILLANGEPVPPDLLELVADRLAVSRELVTPFLGRGIRDLYSEGICGGAILPLGTAGAPRAEVHVPLAHQSALAGVMLAAQAMSLGNVRGLTSVTRVNVLRSIHPLFLTQYAAKDPRGICICQDKDYVDVYRRKYGRAKRG